MFQFIYISVLFIFGFNLSMCFEEGWQVYQNELRNANREELVITSVSSDENFELDAHIRKWTSLSVGPTCYSVGLMDTGLSILFTTQNSNTTGIQIKSKIIELTKQPLDAILLLQKELGVIEILLVVAFQGDLELKWYKIRETELEPFWAWNLAQPLVHINTFSLDRKNVLLLATNSTHNSTRVDLYQYQLKNERKYWIWQSLDVSTPVTSSAFNSFEFDSYLSLPYTSLDLVGIFKLEDNHFVHYKTLRSRNVDSVVSFEIGFESFLAIDGSSAGIYQFKKNHIRRKRIVNSNLNEIVYWLPVPVKTYRDEVVLLAQRNISYSSHMGYVIEIITYNGVRFEEHEDIPCNNHGEEVEWLTCLGEGNSIVGSSFVAAGEQLGLVIPKASNTSFIFMIAFALKQMPNPLELELNALAIEKERIQETLEEYESIRKTSKMTTATVEGPHQVLLSRQAQNENISLVTEELEAIKKDIEEVKEKVDKIAQKGSRRQFDVITINGVVEIEGEGKFKEIEVAQLGGEPASELLDDIVGKDSTRTISGDKIVKTLNVSNVVFGKINGIEARELIFRNDSPIELAGNIIVHDTAEIENVNLLSKQINDIDLLSKIVDMTNEHNGNLSFKMVKVKNEFQANIINDNPIHSNGPNLSNDIDTLDLSQGLDTAVLLQNLTVTNINGDDFDIFVRQLCLINIKCYVPGDLKINGDIIADKGSVSYLNDIKFPEHYIFKEQDDESTVITGRKTFRNTLIAKEIRSRGKIDGVDTKKLITLSSAQIKIPGKITFKDIEVTEELNVTGEIIGQDIDKFLPNPTLQYVNNIRCNVNLKKLEVDGNIIIENNLNGDNFVATLKDLVYKDEETAQILVQKNFPKGFSVKQNLKIDSNSINHVNLDSLVTKDTDQVLNITMLKGDVIMNHTVMGGKFDGTNMTRLDQDLVKLSGEQYLSSTLIFKEDLEAESFKISETLNKINLKEYLYTNGDRDIEANIRFKNINAENITVLGNFTGTISELDARNFAGSYLSYTKDQTVEAHYSIANSTIDNLTSERINGENYEDYFSPEKFAENIKEMLNTGEVEIQDLYVNGPLNIDSINGKNDSDWLPRDILSDFDGKYRRELVIEGNIVFSTLKIDNLSDIGWNWYNQQLVRKDEATSVKIEASMNFLAGIRVAKLIETKKFNGILIDNILTIQGTQTVSGPVTIKGAVTLSEDVNITEHLNDAAVGKILDNLFIQDGTYHVQGDMFFQRLPHIYNLEVEGYANNKNITEHLSQVVRLDEDSTFYEEIVFEEAVVIAGNLDIEQVLNGIDLSEIENQIILTTKDAEVQGPIIFSQPVVIRGNLTINRDLLTHTLYGVDLAEWQNNAVHLDKGMVRGNYKLDDIIIKDILKVEYLNGMHMDFIIPLRSNQTIEYLEFEDVNVTNNIPMIGLVNGYNNLSAEFEDTVMIDEDQRIDSNMVFNKVILVRKKLSTSLINDKDVSKIITTNTDQNLTSTFNFKSPCRMDSDLQVYGLINGINTTVWQNKDVKTYSSEVQEIYDNWNVVHNVTFSGKAEGLGFISGLNLSRIMSEVEDRMNYKYKSEKNIIENYNNVCIDVSYMYKELKKQIYKFMHFEDFQTITFGNPVQLALYFQFKDNHYLLVNENKCSSQLLIFRSTKFEYLSTVETGHIGQVVIVRGNNSIYLVTRGVHSKMKCKLEGTNVWNFDGETLEFHYNIEEQSLLEESLVPFTFYGLSKEGVVEFKVNYNVPRRYRKWKVFKDNVAFMPRGLKTGFSLRTGQKIIILERSDPLVDDFSLDTTSLIIGGTKEIVNSIVPGRSGGDLVVTEVGIKSARRSLIAVATHEETSVRGRLDFVKIYNDVFEGEMFHKVPAYKPSSLLSVEFDQGETLLAFMENERILQIYEYRGIEGFKHRSSAKVEGSKLFLMTLPIEPYLNSRKAIGIIHKNTIKIVQSIMSGNRISDNLQCGL